MRIVLGRGTSRLCSAKKIGVVSCLGLLVLSFMLAFPQLGYVPSSSASSPQSGIALTLTASPPILPSDSGSYQSLVLEFKNLTSGLPFIPQSAVTISMTSNNLQVGSVLGSVVFPAGSLFVRTSFATTSSPGQTTVNAFAAGYSPASLLVTTSLAGGIPTALQVFLSPTEIPPNSAVSGQVIVVPVDSFGNPVKLGLNLVVSLSSSNSQYGSVPSTLTILAGSSYAVAAFTPTYLAGQTIITASAGGLSAGSAVMTTVGPVAGKLAISIAPSKILASSSENVTIAVQLQDISTQSPALTSKNVLVTVTSNSTSVAPIPNSQRNLTILAGSSNAVFTIHAGGGAGAAVITASAPGYVSATATLAAVAGPFSPPNALGLFFAPSLLLDQNTTYSGGVIAELQSCSGGNCVPANSSLRTVVYARSSDNSTMQVSTTPIVINAGASHNSTFIRSTFLPGSAIVTAQAEGLGSTTATVQSFGITPNALNVQLGSPTVLADGETYDYLTIGLINEPSGSPATAPANVIVTLSSTTKLVGQIPSFLTIPAGSTFATTSFVSSSLSGSTVIVAQAQGYATANSTLTLINPPATALQLYATPGVILANGETYQNLIIQIQNQFGFPEKTDSSVPVFLTTANLATGTVPGQVTIQPGSTFATVGLTSTNSPGLISVSAFASGFQSASTSVNSTLLPLSAQLQLSSAYISYGGKSGATVSVASNGVPLNGASLSWTAAGGSLPATSSATNSSGMGSATFQAGSTTGSFQVQVQVSMPGYTNTIASISGSVYNPNIQQPTKPNNGFVSSIPVIGPFLATTVFSIPVWIILPVVIGAGAVSAIMVRRLLYGPVEYEEEE